MPGFDGTGPMGAGSMTGGARGHCNPAGAGYAPAYGRGYGYGPGYGRGRGFGAGFGRGRGLGWSSPYPARGAGYGPSYGAPYQMDPLEEMNMLRTEAESMKRGLDEINRRIEALEKGASG
jgi:Family of unknown function (DUF5320)